MWEIFVNMLACFRSSEKSDGDHHSSFRFKVQSSCCKRNNVIIVTTDDDDVMDRVRQMLSTIQ